MKLIICAALIFVLSNSNADSAAVNVEQKTGKVIKKIIFTDKAPVPTGPFSQAVVAGNTVYVSGCIGVSLETGELVGGFEEQAHLSLTYLKNILDASGSSLSNVLKLTIFLHDINNFPRVNEILRDVFKRDFPARSTFQAVNLPFGALFEVEAIALTDQVKIDRNASVPNLGIRHTQIS